jgi:hypothetical protein
VTSPLESPGSPDLVRATSAESLPSLARFQRPGDARGWYVVVDPAGRYPALGRSERSIDFGPAIRTTIFVVCIVGCGILAARDRVSTPITLLFFLLGGAGGALLGGLLAELAGSLLPHTWHRSAKDGPRMRVQPSDGRAWRLCETVSALAGTSSWTDRTVDPRRRAPAILWTAVGRSLEVERQYLDARRALDHESLQDLGRETLARLARERESLDAVETNLRGVLAAARDIDRRRTELERLRRSRAEERELRGRLARSNGSLVGAAESDRQADLSAGLAAETETISELLAASDALLYDLD